MLEPRLLRVKFKPGFKGLCPQNVNFWHADRDIEPSSLVYSAAVDLMNNGLKHDTITHHVNREPLKNIFSVC